MRGTTARRQYLMRVPLARRLAFVNSRPKFGEIRNARQSAAASRSASVLEQKVDACGHGGHMYLAYLRGSRGKHRLLEVPCCEYARRGSLAPHPARLSYPSTKERLVCPVVVLNAGTLGPATRIRRFEVPNWRNTQCETVWRRIPLGPRR